MVIKAMEDYYTTTNSNVHRGVHVLSAEATTLFENARIKVRRPTSISIVLTCFVR